MCVCREDAHSLAHTHAGAGEIRPDSFICLVIARLFDVVTAFRWTVIGFDFLRVCVCVTSVSVHVRKREHVSMHVSVSVSACEREGKSCFACGSGGV